MAISADCQFYMSRQYRSQAETLYDVSAEREPSSSLAPLYSASLQMQCYQIPGLLS